MSELLTLSLTDLATRLRTREASPVELVQAVFQRIDATRETLNAVVSERDREATLQDARASEARIMRSQARSLEGIPVGVKDLENAAGMVTSFGSWLFRDNRAQHDDIHVARLRAAGAIPMAKTNTPEFGPIPITKNLLHGITRSPWNLERTPGGSSGGSAAALVGGVLPLVTASDGGGSVRIPASWTGAFGHKPSQGRVPIGPAPAWDATMMSVYGAITRTVEDACLYLDQVVGPSAEDPSALPHPGYRYAERVREPFPRGLRIGFSPDFGRVLVQAEVAAAVEAGARVFETLGATVQAIAGGPPPMGEEWNALAGFGLAGRLRDVLPGNEDRIQRHLHTLLAAGESMTPTAWARINEGRAQVRDWCANLFGRHDLLVTPTLPYEAPPARGPMPTETDGKAQDPFAAAAFTQPFNLCWQPAATVPVGLTRSGLPIGMQIVAANHRDDLALQAARAFERERPWAEAWPRLDTAARGQA